MIAEPRQGVGLDPIVPLAREADVDAVVVGGSGERLELGKHLGRFLPLREPQVEQEEAGCQSVTLGDVHPEPEPARLLAADHRVGLDHLGTHELEAHPRLVRLRPIDLGQALDHRGGRHRVDGRTDESPHIEQVPVQQAVDLELVDEDALLGRHPHAVRVAVEGDADVRAPARDLLEPLFDVGADRLGVHPAEEGVALRVELADRQPPVTQQAREPARARAVQRLHQHTLIRGSDLVDVDHARQLVAELGVGVEGFDQAGLERVVVLASRG